MTIRVPIAVDYDPKRLKEAQGDLEALGKRGGKMGAALKVGAMGAAGAVAGLGVVLASSVKAAQESQKVTAQLRTRLDKLGLSYKNNAKEIDATIAAQSRLSAFDDEELTKSFTDLVANTKNVDKALQASAAAADLARARNISLESATKIVSGALEGSTGKLKKMGVELKKGASDTEVLAAIQDKYAGSAEAYGKTSAGAQERFQNAIENLKESIGAGLLPILTQLTDWGTKALEWAQANWPAWKDAIVTAFAGVRAYIEKNFVPPIQSIITALQDAWAKWGGTITSIVRTAFDTVRRYLQNIVTIFRGIIQTISALISGDFSRVWGGIKTILRGLLEQVKTIISGFASIFLTAGKALGKAILDGIVAGLRGAINIAGDIGKSIYNAIARVINRVIPDKIPIPLAPDIPLPKNPLPYLADGGIVTRPTVAMIGEAGPEAVVPLTGPRARNIGTTYNITVNAGLGTDGQFVGREIVRALQAFTRTNGSFASWVT